MSEINHDPMISEILKQMPKPGIPADLVALIESKTILKRSWWEFDGFRGRWLPILVGVATAVGALWLSKLQQNPRPEGAIPMAAVVPARPPVVSHALLPKEESSNTEKGDSREN